MKRIVIILLALAPISIFAQGTLVNKYFDELSDNDAYTKVSISSKMFSLFSELEPGTEAEKEFLNAASKLKGLKIIVADTIPNAAAMYSKAIKDVDKNGYEELMSVKDAEENMKFSIKEKGGIIEELLMIVGGKRRFVLLSLYGEIDLKNISKITNALRVDGMEHLKQLEENEKKN